MSAQSHKSSTTEDSFVKDFPSLEEMEHDHVVGSAGSPSTCSGCTKCQGQAALEGTGETAHKCPHTNESKIASGSEAAANDSQPTTCSCSNGTKESKDNNNTNNNNDSNNNKGEDKSSLACYQTKAIQIAKKSARSAKQTSMAVLRRAYTTTCKVSEQVSISIQYHYRLLAEGKYKEFFDSPHVRYSILTTVGLISIYGVHRVSSAILLRRGYPARGPFGLFGHGSSGAAGRRGAAAVAAKSKNGFWAWLTGSSSSSSSASSSGSSRGSGSFKSHLGPDSVNFENALAQLKTSVTTVASATTDALQNVFGSTGNAAVHAGKFTLDVSKAMYDAGATVVSSTWSAAQGVVTEDRVTAVREGSQKIADYVQNEGYEATSSMLSNGAELAKKLAQGLGDVAVKTASVATSASIEAAGKIKEAADEWISNNNGGK